MIAEVIATFGRHLLLRDAQGAVRMARPVGRTLDIVCGDRVHCQADGEALLVTSTAPRDTLLRRSSLRGRSEPLAANLSQLAVVLTTVPEPDFFMIDRYLCAAECASLKILLVHNKAELPQTADFTQSLQPYAALGYNIIDTSTKSPAIRDTGTALLRSALQNHTTVMVGQSGVGKSSLTRLLTSDPAEIVIGDLMREEEGRHTTTASRLYDCDGGGHIIDSPGVRDFAPAIDDLEPTTLGFREVANLASQCRFQDCKHLQEPQCAVRAAVESGSMNARRHESYRRLRRLYDQLWEKRPAGERAAHRR